MEGNAKGSFSQRRQEAIEISLQPSQWLYTWVILCCLYFIEGGRKKGEGKGGEN